uniref:Uncharacterized protein n=1 Tax=Rhizophora mucronata TaxID=61149 RepID=A0A2P2N9R3_RHIMU
MWVRQGKGLASVGFENFDLQHISKGCITHINTEKQ